MAAIAAIVVAVVLGSVGGTGLAERAAERALRERFSPIEVVSVDISRGHRSPFSRTIQQVRVKMEGFVAPAGAEGLKMGRRAHMVGKVSRLIVDARDFEAPGNSRRAGPASGATGGLRVRELQFVLTGIRYDLGKALLRRRLVLLGFGPAQGRIALDENALNDFLRPRVTQLENFRLDVLERRIVVTGSRPTLGVKLPVELEGSLRARGGQIHLVLPRIRVWFLPLPGFVTRRLLSQVNPLVDVNRGSRGPFRFHITALRLKKDMLEAEVRGEPVQGGTSSESAQFTGARHESC